MSYNLTRAESLLDEPDQGFSIGGGNFAGSNVAGGFGASGAGSGMGSGIGRPAGLAVDRQGTGNFVGARSNYTNSEMGDSDTAGPRWG